MEVYQNHLLHITIHLQLLRNRNQGVINNRRNKKATEVLDPL